MNLGALTCITGHPASDSIVADIYNFSSPIKNSALYRVLLFSLTYLTVPLSGLPLNPLVMLFLLRKSNTLL